MTDQRESQKKPTGWEMGLSIVFVIGFYGIVKQTFPVVFWQVYLGVAAICSVGLFQSKRSSKSDLVEDVDSASRTRIRLENTALNFAVIGVFKTVVHFLPNAFWLILVAAAVIFWIGYKEKRRTNDSGPGIDGNSRGQ